MSQSICRRRTACLFVAGMLGAIGPIPGVGIAADRRPDGAGVRTASPPVRAARVVLVSDAVGDPGFTPESAADSPTESSGAFDATRGDLGTDDDLGAQPARRRRRGRLPADAPSPADALPDPLAGEPRIDPGATGVDAERALATMLPERSDAPWDWLAPLEPLHACGEPRALPPCVPPPPCHPAAPAAPFDLVGVLGTPSCGPIYRGPCEPRSARVHEGPWRWFHAFHDRLFDAFYTPR